MATGANRRDRDSWPLGDLELAPDAVDLWWTVPDDARAPALRDACLALLGSDERARHDRFRSDQDRHRFLVAHALVRAVLSRYAGVDPRAWRFETTAHGRPEIAGPPAPGLRFNLSHTAGLVACLVGRGRAVGVDAEDVERPGDRDRLAARRFTPEENAALARLPPADRRRRFFEYWTLKEAYVKARGTGLTIPLAHVAFRIVDGEPVRLMATPHLDDDPARWHLALLRPTDRHVVAVALERGGAGVPEIRSRRCVPLAGAQPREAP